MGLGAISAGEYSVGPVQIERVRIALESKQSETDENGEMRRYAVSVECFEVLKDVESIGKIDNVAAQATEIYGCFFGCPQMNISLANNGYWVLVDDDVSPEVGMDGRVRHSQIYGTVTDWTEEIVGASDAPARLTGGEAIGPNILDSVRCAYELRDVEESDDIDGQVEEYRHTVCVRFHKDWKNATGFKPIEGTIIELLPIRGYLAGCANAIDISTSSDYGSPIPPLLTLEELTSAGFGVIRQDMTMVSPANAWEPAVWKPEI